MKTLIFNGSPKIYSLNTNVLSAAKDEAALARCREVADMLNNKCE